MIKHVDIDFYIRNCNRDGSLTVDDMIQFEKVHINKIFSYGNIWEELPMGMSARLECLGNIENSDDLVLLRITKA